MGGVTDSAGRRKRSTQYYFPGAFAAPLSPWRRPGFHPGYVAAWNAGGTNPDFIRATSCAAQSLCAGCCSCINHAHTLSSEAPLPRRPRKPFDWSTAFIAVVVVSAAVVVYTRDGQARFL